MPRSASVMPNDQPQYLAHLSALRQDANSPSSATVRSLDDLIDRFPSLAPKDDSSILDHHPSLSREDGFMSAIGKIFLNALWPVSGSVFFSRLRDSCDIKLFTLHHITVKSYAIVL